MYHYHTLSNGIKIVLSRNASRVVYSGVYINVGSRHESGSDEGIAHFIEHSLFKGTSHRRAHHILNRIDGVGGELNAFTTKEETCIYATSLCEHLSRCLELFADILFHSTFPDAEIEREKEVVVEEINSYADTPSESIFDHFEELAFVNNSLGHNILGTKRNVRHFTPEHLRLRLRQCYIPSRMVIAVAGDVDFSHLVRLCERYFGPYTDPSDALHLDMPPAGQIADFDLHLHRRTHQAHILIGCTAPSIYNADKTAFTLLNNIVGGPAMNSRLNVALREHNGFCYSVESQYVPFSDTGIFYVYAGVDIDAVQRACDMIRRELQQMAATALTDTALLRAQRQLVGQMTINNDNGLNEMQSIGKALLGFDHVDTLDEMTADILSVTPAQLQAVAQRFFASFSTLVYGGN